MNNLNELVKRLQGKNISEIARRAQITRAYIYFLISGERANPTYHTMRAIEKAIDEMEADQG